MAKLEERTRQKDNIATKEYVYGVCCKQKPPAKQAAMHSMSGVPSWYNTERQQKSLNATYGIDTICNHYVQMSKL